MKTLNFQKLNLQKEDFLSKTQMKNILGGYGNGTCGTVHYVSGSANKCLDNYGQSQSDAKSDRDYINSNISNGEVNWWSASQVTYCCDSCGNFEPCTYDNAF